jgi:hypothetical protein
LLTAHFHYSDTKFPWPQNGLFWTEIKFGWIHFAYEAEQGVKKFLSS